MISQSKVLGGIELPLITGHHAMIPFDSQTLEGIPTEFVCLVKQMLSGISNLAGTAFFTIHGRILKKGETLRRPGPHTDGNYEPYHASWGRGGGNGWKVGENGPAVGTELHARQYVSPYGGIVMASNYEACVGWNGEYDGVPSVGGDCSNIQLDEPFLLNRNTIYYGNNHFIHESLPMADDIHRVLARITLPQTHQFQ